MALEYRQFKNITAKELTLTDDSFKLKGNYVDTGNFSYTGYEILKDASDVKTNNYSNLILSKKRKNSEVLDVNEPEKVENDLDIITSLSFFSNSVDSVNKGAWLCFNKSYDTWDMDITSATFAITHGRPNYHGNYLFRLNCSNETNICKISHNFADQTYYLAYDTEKNVFTFTDKSASPTTEFLCHLDGHLMRLYHRVDDVLKKVTCKRTDVNSYILLLDDYDSTSDGSINDNIFITKEQDTFNYYVDSSWVTYDRRNKIDTIANEYSDFNLDSQFLIHHEYAGDDTINILPLKNHLTYQGSLVNGCSTQRSADGFYVKKPAVDYRTYAGITSGVNQEHGNDNITLTFTFSDQEYHIQPGEEYAFTIPAKGESELSPLYPYNTLNINDSAFVRNGAFGSDIPLIADKVIKTQNENTKYNNGTYLCTWLYQPNPEATPVWLDRYYYPDMVHRYKAMTGDVFEPSFENILDDTYNDEVAKEQDGYDSYMQEDIENLKLNLQNNTYVDKKSDVILEPGASYKYRRVGKDDITTAFNTLEENRIAVVKDQKGNSVNLDAAFAFNRENWRSIPSENFKNTSAINFNTNLYINPYKKMGIQLFGSDYNYGVNIQNRKDLAPFHYYASPYAVHLLNNNYEIRQSCNIYEKYTTEIKRLIIGEPFENIYVLTHDSIIIMEYDLKLKSRILYKDITDLYDITMTDEETIGDIVSGYAPLIINTNLYIPINTKNNRYIIKIVFLPDKEGETTLSARILDSTEYINNFTNTFDETLSETQAIIKSLYTDKEGNIYAFNYDKLKMTADGDTIYGVYSNDLNAGDNWYYIFNQSVGRLHSSAAASKYAEFSSDTSIDNIAFNPLGEMALIRGFRPNATTKEIDNRHKALEIYNRTKTKVYNYPLKDYDSVKTLDYYCYIDEALEEQMVFSAMCIRNNKIVVIEYQSYFERVKEHYTGIDADCLANLYECTNSNKLIDRYNENKMYFNLFLPNGIENEKITIEWDLKDAQEGWYNINLEADTDNAMFRVRLNDEIFKQVSYKDNPRFARYTHTNDSVFDGTYFFGSIGKDHGARLFEILYDGVYDPYTLKNTKTENTTLYNRALKYHEYQATRLYYNRINPLTITLPCGPRNGVEEIVRYFRYRNPGFVSNKIKLNICGLDDIKYESELNALKSDILEALNQHGDCLTKINDIEFINHEL